MSTKIERRRALIALADIADKECPATDEHYDPEKLAAYFAHGDALAGAMRRDYEKLLAIAEAAKADHAKREWCVLSDGRKCPLCNALDAWENDDD